MSEYNTFYYKVVEIRREEQKMRSWYSSFALHYGHSSPIRTTARVRQTQTCENGDYAILCTDTNFVNMYESKHGPLSHSPLVTV